MPAPGRSLTPAPDEASAARHRSLRRFALGVAGPRDLAINAVINGVVAAWLYGGGTAIPLTGPQSVFSMLLPMVFIEATLTTFFGLLAGRQFQRQQHPGREPQPNIRWLVGAVLPSLRIGGFCWLVAWLAQALLRRAAPGITLGWKSVVVLIATLAGLLAFGLHARAVLVAGRRGAEATP
jgi:hypothetical protein